MINTIKSARLLIQGDNVQQCPQTSESVPASLPIQFFVTCEILDLWFIRVTDKVPLTRRSFSCTASSSSFPSSTMIQHLVHLECVHAARARGKVWNACWRPGARKALPVLLICQKLHIIELWEQAMKYLG